MPVSSVITDPKFITANSLTDRLRKNGHLDQGKITAIHVGDRLIADRPIYPVQVEYSSEISTAIPNCFIYKYNHPGGRAGIWEGVFYSEIAPAMPDCPVPDCFDVGIDYQVGHAHILLADLSATHAPAIPRPELT